MGEKATGIAYGIEFFVGRRQRDRAISDVRTASELINQNSLMAFKKGSTDRQKAHDQNIQALRTKSTKALKELSTGRKKAAAEATQAFEGMKPPSQEALESKKGRKMSTDEIEEYSNTFGRELKAMDSSLAQFVERSGKMGMNLGDASDTAGVMSKFAESDVQDRARMIADLEEQKRLKVENYKQLEKESLIVKKNQKEAEKNAKKKKDELDAAKKLRDEMKAQGKDITEQNKIVKSLAGKWGHANKAAKRYADEMAKIEEEMKDVKAGSEAHQKLLNSLNTLQKKATAEERKYGTVMREIKQEEIRLDRELYEHEKNAILLQREHNQLMNEYARHVDDAAEKVGSTLKNAFIIGTAAITALNYKLMSVVSAFQEFETQMVNAQSIWQTSNEQLFEISDSVVEFGTRFGVEMGNATAGLYQYASAGVGAAESMEMLQHTLKLSMAVQGDHNTLSKLTTQTLMGFNMEFAQAEEVTDKFAHAINKSLIEWDDLASSVKFALPFFTSTGQSIDQLLGGLEVLTNRALEAGIAGRGLRQALAEFAQHADDNAAAFRKMGVEIMNTDGTMKQLTEIAQEFKVAMGDGATDMEVMIALMEDLNVRGATAFVHLAQNADEFEAAVSNLSNSSGEAAEMAEIQQSSLANQIQVVKNAMMAPFILSDKIGKEAGYLNQFAMEIHGIVEVVEDLFVKKMADGSIALTKMGEIIRDFVIGALRQAKDVLVILVKIVGQFAEQGHSMTGMLHAAAIPLKLVAKLAALLGDGFFEAIIAYKVLNGLIPINSAVMAHNIANIKMAIQSKMVEANTTKTLTAVSATGLQMTKASGKWKYVESQRTATAVVQKRLDAQTTDLQTMSTGRLNTSMGALLKTQMLSKGIMMIAMFATQKLAKDNWALAGIIGALAGAYMGYAIALQMVAAGQMEVKAGGMLFGSNMTRAMLWGAVAGASFNIMMQQMMKPDMSDMPEISDVSTMDTGGRFMARRMYDLGGYTQEHGLAVLQAGETVIPKTQNMLGGNDSGITINISGDVYDGDNFADKVGNALPYALRNQRDIGGI